MAADGHIGGNDGFPRGQTVPTAALVHELTEALTALGNYLASANKIYDSTPQSQRLGEALEKSLGQHERAVEATRRLRDLGRPRRRVDGDCLIGLR